MQQGTNRSRGGASVARMFRRAHRNGLIILLAMLALAAPAVAAARAPSIGLARYAISRYWHGFHHIRFGGCRQDSRRTVCRDFMEVTACVNGTGCSQSTMTGSDSVIWHQGRLLVNPGPGSLLVTVPVA